MTNATLLPISTRPVTTGGSIPWHGWVAVCGVACLPIGLLWDISWHSTIGRDTFWTPAHIVIQLGGIVPALLFAWLALKITFRGTAEERAGAVRVFGARAPLGAWLTMWGAAAMVTSAPFDDWWHDTYGLDVQIVSPPHSVLGMGMLAVTVGVLLFVFSGQNRTHGEPLKTAALLCALAAGVMLTLFSDFLTEFTFPNQQRSAAFYKITAAVFPLALVLTARASRLRWPATIAAGTYMGVLVLMVWILPLFPAQPMLAPIYNPVDRMVPPAFPLLLVLPALGIDLVMRRSARCAAAEEAEGTRGGRRLGEPASTRDAVERNAVRKWLRAFGQSDWRLAIGLAVVFLAIFVPVQWFFSAFLLSDAADNWVFARSGHWPYWVEPNEWLNRFWDRSVTPLTGAELAKAFAIAVVSSRLGLWCGSYLLKVRR